MKAYPSFAEWKDEVRVLHAERVTAAVSDRTSDEHLRKLFDKNMTPQQAVDSMTLDNVSTKSKRKSA